MADSSSKTIVASSLFFLTFMGGAAGYFMFQSAEPQPPAIVQPAVAQTAPVPAPAPALSPVEGEPSPAPKLPLAASARARSPAGRMARDLKREQIWSALGSSPAQQRAPAEAGAPAGGEEPPLPALSELPQLDTAYIQDAVREQLLPVIQECYESALEDEPELGGELIVQFTIIGAEDIGGVVEDAQINEASTLESAFVSECMRESVMGVTFEPPEDGGSVTVNYPFVFAPE